MVKGWRWLGEKRHCLPKVLHASQEVVTALIAGGLGVAVVVAGGLGAAGGLEAVVVVVVVIVLVTGHVNIDVAALVAVKHPISSFLDLFSFWDLLECVLLLFRVVLLRKLV